MDVSPREALTLVALDDAVLGAVCALLDISSLARLRTTCRRFATVGASTLALRLELDVSALGRSAGGALRMAAARCLRLQRLSACDVHPLTDADLSALLAAAGASLRELRLRGLRHVSNDALAALARAGPTQLALLDLAGCRRVSDGALAAVLLAPRSAAASLTSVDLSDTAVTDAGLRLLARCPALAHVALGVSVTADGVQFQYAGGSGGGSARVAGGITDAGLCAFLADAAAAHPSGAAPLRSLALPHRKAVRHEALLPALHAHCPQLEALDVRNTRMCGAAVVRAFADAPGAARAHTLLAGTLASSCGDADLAELAARCVSLVQLDLSNHDLVTDYGLCCLAALPALRELTLVRNNRITPAGA